MMNIVESVALAVLILFGIPLVVLGLMAWVGFLYSFLIGD